MKPFCEVVVLEILPAVRAIVATKLVTDYGFSQTLAAKKLGVSQPAVSQYKRSLRGAGTDILEKYPQVAELAGGVAARIASGRDEGEWSTMMFCEICRKVRLSGAGCEIHRNYDGSLSGCNICMANQAFFGGEQRKARKQKPAVRPLTKFTKRR